MTQAYLQLQDTIQATRQLWRARRGIEGLLLVLAIALAVLLTAALADHLFDFNPLGRFAMAALLWLTILGSMWQWVMRPILVPHSEDFFAALLEQQMPALGNRLLNALQLGREDNPLAPRLVEAIVADGFAATDDIEIGRAVKSPAMIRHGCALGAMLLVAFAVVILGGPAVKTSLARVLLPGADIAPFTWTTVRVSVDPSLRVLAGTPLTITATTSGRVPTETMLHWQHRSRHDRSGRELAVGMMTRSQGTFSHTFASVDAGFTFRITAGDAQSAPITIVVDPRPHVESMSVTYNPPAYTALSPQTIENFDGHLTGLAHTQAIVRFHTNKPLADLKLDRPHQSLASDDPTTWPFSLTLQTDTEYRLQLVDQQGYEVDDPTIYRITIQRDTPPRITFTKPGRDVQRQPGTSVDFTLIAQDDYGLGPIQMHASINDQNESNPIHTWPNDQAQPQQRVELNLLRTIEQLGLKAGDRMQYWASARDRNDVAEHPGRAESQRYHIVVLTPELADQILARHLMDYAKVAEQLIHMQRLNRAETFQIKPAQGLLDRQGLIRRHSLRLADLMDRNAFPGRSIIHELRKLAKNPMAHVISLLENYRDAPTLDGGKSFVNQSLPIQDQIIQMLEELLIRLNRNEQIRKILKKIHKTDPVAHGKVKAMLGQLAQDLDKFLTDIRDLEEKFDKLPKRRIDEFTGEDLAKLNDADHRLDRWKQWAKDSVDQITKLPQGFVKDSHLAENISTIFEEIDKKARDKTTEPTTPIEEGVKMLATEVLEDLEMWMPHKGDSIKWTMEDPIEGKFEVPEAKLPSHLQDIMGDLIEDVQEFDEEADDVTGAWGGNIPAGWDIVDGPISSFGAVGKTGNQLPNASEMTGRSGAGRRGRSSGQMAGAESNAFEGRPTPTRLTNEPYEQGNINASKQLNPRGATGGGKKTGAGQRGLQGGTPPDFVQQLLRLAEKQKLVREKAQKISQQLNYAGRPTSRVLDAIRLFKAAEQDLRDLRYGDAARKRKGGLHELRAEHSQIDQVLSLSLQKASNLPPDLREQIIAGSRQALPDGYEDLVGAYYKALSNTGTDEDL